MTLIIITTKIFLEFISLFAYQFLILNVGFTKIIIIKSKGIALFLYVRKEHFTYFQPFQQRPVTDFIERA